MSIRVYLNADPKDENGPMHGHLKQTPCKEGYYFKGIRISQDRSSGIWYVESQTVTAEVPPLILELVDFVTLEEVFTVDAKRELGIYEHNTAKAELRFSPSSNHYILHIRSTNWKDLCDLHVSIRSGSIRPKMSYEVKQVGLSLQQILDKLEKAEETISSYRKRISEFDDYFRVWKEKLSKQRWPWNSKKGIIATLEAYDESFANRLMRS